jgi:P pilus assembly chaperone PapD
MILRQTVGIFLFLCISMYAISVQLPQDTLDISYEQASSVIVTNPSEEIKAVELLVKKRSYSLDGQEIHQDTDEFFIIPSQFIINPSEEQVVTLQWIGESTVDYELPYRIIIQEVPLVEDSRSIQTTTNASVQIRLRFVNSFYVVDHSVSEKIILNSTVISGNETICEFENVGEKHKIISGFEFKVNHKSENDVVSISAETLKKNYNFLPKEKRLISFVTPDDMPSSNATYKLHRLF